MLCIGIGLIQAFFLAWYLPSPTVSREANLAPVLQGWQARATPELMTGQEFCEAWTGHPISEVDCRTGRLIATLAPQESAESAAIIQKAIAQARERISVLQNLRKEIAQTQEKLISNNLILQALDTRIAYVLPQIEALERSSEQHKITAADYPLVFELLINLEGQSYQSLKGTFKNKRWDIAQTIQNQTDTMQRGLDLVTGLKWLPYLFFCFSTCLLTLAHWRAQRLGLFCMFFYLTATLLGLLITADASVHFGENSLYYPLNPLGNQLYRQIGVTGFAYALLMLVLMGRSPIENLMRLVLRHSLITTCLISTFIFSAYFLKSPAVGSEAMKLGIAILAGVVLTDQSRALHLARKYAPDAFSFSRLLQWLRLAPIQRVDATHRVVAHIARPLSVFVAFACFTLGSASLIFNDLGGALISTLMVIIALFLTFGSRLTLLAIACLVGSAALLSLTDKLQNRIELMIAPMTATISDFARLLAFTEASAPSGFGLGHIAWCNQEGTCLPIQVLSDYMPTALNGISGPWMTLLVFLAICCFFLVIAGISCWRFITREGIERYIGIVTFFLASATVIQTILTFLGNWRLIPLTGMGAPLLSIGLSSILASTLALGLFLVFHESQTAGIEQ